MNLDAWVSGIKSMTDKSKAETPEERRQRLLPRLESKLSPPANIRLTQAVPGLGLDIGFWFDYEPAKVSLGTQEAAQFGLDESGLYAEALANLRKRFPAEMVRDVVENKNVRFSNTNDGYDAVRILLVPQYIREGEAVATVIVRENGLVMYPVDATIDNQSIWTFLRARILMNIENHGREGVLLEYPIRVTVDGFEVITGTG